MNVIAEILDRILAGLAIFILGLSFAVIGLFAPIAAMQAMKNALNRNKGLK